MDKKRGLKIILVCSILAIITFSYLLYIHYKPTESKFCNFGEGFNCDIVNKSIYSEIMGIPVSLLGALTFIGVLALSILSLNSYKKKFSYYFTIDINSMTKLIFWISVISLLFALYLIYIEAFVLYSFCIFCLIGDILIIITLITSYLLMKRGDRK
ncbi:vitamin K epoxide reductase family protein [Candidatus Woesearchaeota archaeon]|nr:vitamin K epoxide reductase family protein [Candidatus Woesearchaeota archaeon]